MHPRAIVSRKGTIIEQVVTRKAKKFIPMIAFVVPTYFPCETTKSKRPKMLAQASDRFEFEYSFFFFKGATYSTNVQTIKMSYL